MGTNTLNLAYAIRAFEPADQKQAASLVAEAYEDAVRNEPEDVRTAEREYMEWSLREDLRDIAEHYFARPDTCFWVAVHGTSVVGTVGLDRHETGAAELRRMAVHRDFRRRGIGAALLDTAERWAVSHGYPRITLTTVHPLRDAIRLYEARGYSLTGSEEYGSITAYYYGRDIGPAKKRG